MSTHRCPSSIPAGRWRDLWTECLELLGGPSKAEARLLERMVLNLITADFSLDEGKKQPMVTGSQGQDVESPHFKVAARCDGVAISIARQLRLTPQARSSVSSDATEAPEEEADPVEQARGDELAQRRAAKPA